MQVALAKIVGWQTELDKVSFQSKGQVNQVNLVHSLFNRDQDFLSLLQLHRMLGQLIAHLKTPDNILSHHLLKK